MAERLVGLIPAAGLGTRVRPYSAHLPKSMLPINGIPNLQRIVELMRDQLDIREIVIVTGYCAEVIEDHFGDGRAFGVRIHFVRNTDLDRGLAWSVLLGREHIRTEFCVILSDECYVASNHHELLQAGRRGAFATCGVMEVDDVALIRKNYAVLLDGSRITRLIEKPRQVENDLLGLGTFVFSPEIFAELERAFAESADGYVEFVTLLDRMCQQGREITAFTVRANYVNINDRDSLFQAKFNERAVLFARRSIALLVYAEGHEQRVRFTLQRYRKVVDPAAIYLVVPADNTIATEAAELGVQVLTCPPEVTLYGEKLRYALDRIDHDLVILTEADYAFPGRDIDKLLAYVREADLVVGTRTTRQLIEQGSDLQELVRLANVFLAKLMEVLWWRFVGRFTDVGCTFRAFWMSSYRQMRGDLQARGAEFAVEMIVEALDRRMRVIEIPVNYRNISRSLYRKYRNRRTFFRILRLLFVKRFCRGRRSRPVST